MRDIRPDLKERLSQNGAERSRVHAELKRLEAYGAALMRMIEAEDDLYKSGESSLPDLALPDFLVGEAEKKPSSKEDFRLLAQAHGYTADGRSIHAHVTNLIRSGRLEEIDAGLYRVPSNKSAMAPSMAASAIAEMFK